MASSAERIGKMVERYKPKQNGKSSTIVDDRGRFVKGTPKLPNSGRKKGTPNKNPSSLVEAVMEAAAKVGNDRDVYQKVDGKIVAIEENRIPGLVPYLERTAELYRKDYLRVLAQIISPAVVQLMINNAENMVQVNHGASIEELENEVQKLGISLSLFHGDPGRVPKKIKTIEHDE